MAAMPTTVLAVAGHMIDAPDRAVPRFPASLEPAVEAALARFVDGLGELVVFASAANGADLLLVEAALRHGAEVRLVLPFDRDPFVASSVQPGGAAWIPRFEAVLRQAAGIVVVGDEGGVGDARFEAAALRVEQLAVERAAALQVRPILLCVLDPGAAGAVGGTLGSYQRWTQAGGDVHLLDLRTLRAAATERTGSAGGARQRG